MSHARVHLPTLNRGDCGTAVRLMQPLVETEADGIFGPRTQELVAAFQEAQGIKGSGVVDETTWALLADEARRMRREAAQDALDRDKPQSADLATVVRTCGPLVADQACVALTRGIDYWKSLIVEPPAGDAAVINNMIMGAEGLGWPSGVHPSPARGTPYLRNGDYAWCGAWAALMYAAVKPELRRRYFPSCYRLIAEWGRAEGLIIPFDQAAPGDILIVGVAKGHRRYRWWGNHITVIERIEGDKFHTLEGNAKGRLPDGSWGEGVIRHVRPLTAKHPSTYRAMWVLRLPPAAFMEAA